MAARKLIEVRELDLSDAERNRLLSEESKHPAHRGHEMIAALQEALRFMGPGADATVRAKSVALVDRMWGAYLNAPSGENGDIRMIYDAVRVASETFTGGHARAARTTFWFSVDQKAPERVKDLTPDTMVLAEDAIRAFRRRAGAPKAGDREPRKWESIAALVEAMGYGPQDPDALKREMLRKPAKNSRTSRH